MFTYCLIGIDTHNYISQMDNFTLKKFYNFALMTKSVYFDKNIRLDKLEQMSCTASMGVDIAAKKYKKVLLDEKNT